jgi:micrococcal nuclease
MVRLRVVNTDTSGRTVAEVYRGNQSVNLQLVQEGQAVVYPQHLNNCAATKKQYLQAQATAKQRRLGFWNQAQPVMPWDFRRSQ